MSTWIYVVISLVLLLSTGLLLWKLSRVRNTTHDMVGNHSQIDRAFLKRQKKSGTVQGISSATETTKVVNKRRLPKT